MLNDEQIGLLRSTDLSKFTPRQRAILKLRFGLETLTEEESQKVLPDYKQEITVVRPRTLQEVGAIFGRSRERIRQIEDRLLERLQIPRPSW